MKSRKHLTATIALVAVMAAVVPTALAQTQEYDGMEEIFYPNITGVTAAPDSFDQIVSAAKIGLIEATELADSEFDGVVVGAYLDGYQGYLVYFVDIVDEGEWYEVILDAGTGDVLHEGQRISLTVLEQTFEEWEQEWEEESGWYEEEEEEGQEQAYKEDY